MWSDEIVVDIKSYSMHHIDVVVHTNNGCYWRCTGVYGHPEGDQKHHTWKLLRRLKGLSSLMWLYFEDFNEILHLSEKTGKERCVSAVNDFREAIRFCGLSDLGCKGYPFTWSNRRFRAHLVEERLDIFLSCENWRRAFQDTSATTLLTWTLDHNLIMIEDVEKTIGSKYSRRHFTRIHYEDMWSSYERSEVQRDCEE